MINELLSRPNIQEFLNKYPSNRWKELIADLFEIGVLNLRNSYHRDEYSKKEFKALIYDLEHPYQQYNRPPIQNPNYNYPPKPQYRKSNLPYNQNLYPNYDNYNYYNYDYGRRMNRLKKLEKHASTSQMDAFYSEKNEINNKENVNKRRSHQEIMDKIAKSQQLRDYQRYQIRDLKLQYLQERKEELNQKRMEKIMEKKAEEDIKSEENEMKRIKQEQDFQEGYGEDYQEEDEVEEEEGIDKYNDYNRGYDEEEGEGEEGEQNYQEQNYEEQGEEYAEEEQNYENMEMPEN